MRRILIAVAAGGLLAVTACTGGGSPAPAASEAEVVAWIDKVCGAVDGTVKAVADEPPIDMSDPDKLKSGISDWLGAKVAVADKSITDLKALEDGPHPKSKELVGAAQASVEQVKSLLSGTRSKLDSSADATQAVTAFTEMVGRSGELENAGAGVARKLDETGLATTARKAPNCQGLQAPPPSP